MDRYTVAGISLNWHRPTGTSANEEQKFDIAWRCKTCGSNGVGEHAYSSESLNCFKCQIQSESLQKIVHAGDLQVLITDFFEPTTNDISAQYFIRTEQPLIPS